MFTQHNPGKSNKNNLLTHIVFTAYMLILIWVILFKFGFNLSDIGMHRSINLIPFSQSAVVNGNLDLFEIIANILAFVPLGIYLMIYDLPKNMYSKILLGLMVSLSFELLQFLLGIGASDITDLITNSCGVILGILIFLLAQRLFKEKVVQVFNITFLVLISIFLSLWCLLMLAND